MNMRINQRKNDIFYSGINITNLVDIALTMVIVLLMIAPFIEHGIEVKLPASSPSKIKLEESIIITVAPENRYFIGSEEVNIEKLKNILMNKSKEKEISVVVKGDESVSYKNIIKVLNIAKKCKINTIGLATQEE